MPILLERHLIRLGKSSLGVVIPPGWLNFYEAKAGDPVSLTVNDGVLIEIKNLPDRVKKRKKSDESDERESAD